MTPDDHFSPLSPPQESQRAFKHKAWILNELTHHKCVPSPPPGCALGILLDFDHLLHLQFIISLSQHHKPATTTTTTSLSLQRHRHKQYCLRLALNGEQYNGSLPAVVVKVVPYTGVLQVQT